MILLQGNIVTKLIKKVFPDKIITSEFKKQFIKSLSIFILYLQNCQTKKKYGKDQILSALESEGFGKVAEKLRNSGKILDNPNEEQSRKRIPEKMDIKQLKSE